MIVHQFRCDFMVKRLNGRVDLALRELKKVFVIVIYDIAVFLNKNAIAALFELLKNKYRNVLLVND